METSPIAWCARFFLSVLACWRLSEMLANEDGPFDVLARIRARLGRGFFGRLMDCFQCVSLWTAALLACYVAGLSWHWPVVWLAISGAACLLARLWGSKNAVARLEFEAGVEEADNELLRK